MAEDHEVGGNVESEHVEWLVGNNVDRASGPPLIQVEVVTEDRHERDVGGKGKTELPELDSAERELSHLTAPRQSTRTILGTCGRRGQASCF